jgi:hypothetical protein
LSGATASANIPTSELTSEFLQGYNKIKGAEVLPKQSLRFLMMFLRASLAKMMYASQMKE